MVSVDVKPIEPCSSIGDEVMLNVLRCQLIY